MRRTLARVDTLDTLLQEGALTSREIADEVGVSSGTARRRLTRLLAAGLISRVGRIPRTRYTLTPTGLLLVEAHHATRPGWSPSRRQP